MTQGDVVCLFKSRKEAEDFVEFVLSDEAKRPGRRGYLQKLPLHGKHVSYGRAKDMRGTDLPARVYACVHALELIGESNAQACREVAKRLGDRLGQSRRGRPSQGKRERTLENRAQTVRSMAYKAVYDKSRPPIPKGLWFDNLVAIWRSYVPAPGKESRADFRSVVPKNLGAAWQTGKPASEHAKWVIEHCSRYFQKIYREEATKLLDFKLPPDFLKFIGKFVNALAGGRPGFARPEGGGKIRGTLGRGPCRYGGMDVYLGNYPFNSLSTKRSKEN